MFPHQVLAGLSVVEARTTGDPIHTAIANAPYHLHAHTSPVSHLRLWSDDGIFEPQPRPPLPQSHDSGADPSPLQSPLLQPRVCATPLPRCIPPRAHSPHSPALRHTRALGSNATNPGPQHHTSQFFHLTTIHNPSPTPAHTHRRNHIQLQASRQQATTRQP